MLCLLKGDAEEEALFERENFSGFAVIGAGLPRTGTSSTRLALAQLLEGEAKDSTNNMYRLRLPTTPCRC